LVRQPSLPFGEPRRDPVTPSSPPQNVNWLVGIEFVRHPRARRYVLRVRDDGAVRVTVPRWGSKREARLFAEGQRSWIERERARLAVRASDDPPDTEARALRERAKRELPARLLELASRLGSSVRRISVRNQRWRWGSCSSGGHICLNWRLVLLPAWVRDYVLIHELMHLERLDHSPRFWRLVAAACPEYREARAFLRRRAPG
jgi:predicted metal-dependent hydrolase